MQAILDYRNAEIIRDLFNQGSKGREELGKRPDLLDLLLEMKRAQQPGISLETVLYDMQRQHEDKD